MKARDGDAVLHEGLALFPEHVIWLERAMLVVGSIAVITAVIIGTIATEHENVAMVIVLWHALMTAAMQAARKWAGLAWRRAVLLSYVYFHVGLALFIVGPTAGVGAGFMAAAALATVLFARRGMIVAAVVTAVLLIAAAIGFTSGWTSSVLVLMPVDRPTYWLRIAVMTSTITLVAGLAAAMISSWFGQVYQRTVVALDEQARELDEREHAKRALELAARNEALGQLAGGIAHDINNNLAVILTNTQLIEEAEGGTREEAELLASIMTAAREASQSAGAVLALGRGTTAVQASQPPDSTAFEPSAMRVLLVDDEPSVRRVLGRVVRRAGYQVVEAHDGASASEAFAGEADFDLLLTDAVMPNTNTGAMIRAFRDRHPSKPIIVCSGYVHEEIVLQGIARGEYAFIAKPFRPDELTDLVRRTLLEATARRFDEPSREFSA